MFEYQCKTRCGNITNLILILKKSTIRSSYSGTIKQVCSLGPSYSWESIKEGSEFVKNVLVLLQE